MSNPTPRQIEVLRLMCNGDTNKEIARALHLAPVTVEQHLTTLRRHAEARNKAHLAVWAVKHGYA